ncbi:hypothetical protein LIQ25_12345 [Blautia glucerasea]|uniref:hypothetical protein n=1 Tax=Blautia TaxID=572511 RepID=UPI00156EF1EB|nr:MULTISPECIES: hypothetical protein [Blautia]MCB5383232.1 hypothetical protein [Blautia glucerasea]NSJ70147.1 hypothetical protein [Blautia faecis]
MDNVMYQQAAVSAKTKKETETRRPSFLFVLGMIGTILFSFLAVSEFMKTPVYGADLGNCQYRQSDELESFESLFSDTAASAQEATGYYAQKILIPVVVFCFAALAVIFVIVKITAKVDMLKRYFDVWKNNR